MHLNIRGTLAVTASAALMLSAAACGGSEEPKKANPPASPAAAPAAPVAPTVKVCGAPTTGSWMLPTWEGIGQDPCAYASRTLSVLHMAAIQYNANPQPVTRIVALEESESEMCDGKNTHGSESARTDECTEGTFVVRVPALKTALTSGDEAGTHGSFVLTYAERIMHQNEMSYNLRDAACIYGGLERQIVLNGGMKETTAIAGARLYFGSDKAAAKGFATTYTGGTCEVQE